MKVQSKEKKLIWRVALALLFTYFTSASATSLLNNPTEIGINIAAVIFTAAGMIIYWYEVVSELLKRHKDTNKNPMKAKPKRKNILDAPAIVIICVTVVALASIGAWLYAQQQNVARKERLIQQETELRVYEQEQLNKRNAENNYTEQKKNSSKAECTGDWTTC